MPKPSDSTSLPLRQPAHGLEHDHPGADEDEHALDPRRDVLHLVVPVGVRLVGRLLGLAHREEGDHRRHEVDGRMRGLGQDRDRAGDDARHHLERDHQGVGEDRDRGRPLLARGLGRRTDGEAGRGGRGGNPPARASAHRRGLARGPRRRPPRSERSGPAGRRSFSSSISLDASARAARPRWLMASFSSDANSAMVRSSPG